MINGSPRANGNTNVALEEMAKTFAQEGIETEILHIGNQAIRGCIACGSCAKTNDGRRTGSVSVRYAGYGGWAGKSIRWKAGEDSGKV